MVPSSLTQVDFINENPLDERKFKNRLFVGPYTKKVDCVRLCE